MATISNPEIEFANVLGPNLWEFVVKYKPLFLSGEIGHQFDDSVKLWEMDDGVPNPFGGDDDEVTPYMPVETFGARSPAIQSVRRKRINVRREDLNTEWGDEEIYA